MTHGSLLNETDEWFGDFLWTEALHSFSTKDLVAPILWQFFNDFTKIYETLKSKHR